MAWVDPLLLSVLPSFEMKLASRVALRGKLQPSGDKSIAHRVALLGALAKGRSVFENFAPGDDCKRTLQLLGQLGVAIERHHDTVNVSGKGCFGLEPPRSTLYAGNSGSTARMSCGLLAAQAFDSRLDGDESLRRRPMRRVIDPLLRMGARVDADASNQDRLPLCIRGNRRLRAIDYRLPVASAQVKTAILLAGLHAEGRTTVEELHPSRNHTEIALARFGAAVKVEAQRVELEAGAALQPVHYRLPGDLSSAAFFIAAAAALPGSDLLVEDVGLNPTRTGLLEVLESMGADITIEESSNDEAGDKGERIGSLRVKGAELCGTPVPTALVPRLIDEIPVLAVAAALATGETTIRGASELRHKESDRLRGIATGLRALGADVELLPDGLVIRGGRRFREARLDSQGDHRMAMAWAVACLATEGHCHIHGRDSVAVSYPAFWDDLRRLTS